MIPARTPSQMTTARQLARKAFGACLTVMLMELLHCAALLEVEAWKTVYRDPV